MTVDVTSCKGASLGTDGAGNAVNHLARLELGCDAKPRIRSWKCDLMKRVRSYVLGEGVGLQSREVPQSILSPPAGEIPGFNEGSGPRAWRPWLVLPTKAQGSREWVKGNLSKSTHNSCLCILVVLMVRVVLNPPKGIWDKACGQDTPLHSQWVPWHHPPPSPRPTHLELPHLVGRRCTPTSHQISGPAGSY